MATSSDPPASDGTSGVGLDHPTVVPANFDAPSTDGEDDRNDG